MARFQENRCLARDSFQNNFSHLLLRALPRMGDIPVVDISLRSFRPKWNRTTIAVLHN